MKRNNSHSALQLWLTLASIPVLAVIAVYVYGVIIFDDNKIIEIDNSAVQFESERLDSDDLGSELDRAFSAPLDTPTKSSLSGRSSSILSNSSSAKKEESLSQMLSKKNENLRMSSNGHPEVIRVQEDDNLERLSSKYLGNAVFWPYIYLVNRDKLSSPASVKPGMTLNLPDSVFYDLNLNDTLAIQKADALGKSIQGASNN